MSLAQLMPFIAAQFTDDDGAPYAAGTLTVYNTGTTVKPTIYASADEQATQSNPLTLDSAGRIPDGLFLASGFYDYLLKDADGNTVKTQTNVQTVQPFTDTLQIVQTVTALRALTAGSSTYALLLGYSAIGDFQHTYYWSASSSTADDNITVIQPASLPASGRWLIVNSNPLRATGRQAPTWSSSTASPSVFGVDRLVPSNTSGGVVTATLSTMTDGQILHVTNLSTSYALRIKSGDGNSYYTLSAYVTGNSNISGILWYDSTSTKWFSALPYTIA
jgi:hypothetical protein